MVSGSEGRVRLATIVVDAQGRPIDIGPSGGPDLGQVVEWRLRPTRRLVEATTLGEAYRRYGAGLASWSAEIDLLWDAASTTGVQDELWRCVLEDDFGGSLADRGRIELTLYVDGTTPGAKNAYYGAAVLERARVVATREDLVRFRATFAGVGPLHYGNALFAAGSYGAMAAYSYAALEAYTFGGLESIAEK